MSNSVLNKERDGEDYIDVSAVLKFLWADRLLVLVVVGVFLFSAAVYLSVAKTTYQSKVVLAPTEESLGGGVSALAGQLGGLASIAGINVNSPSSDKKVMAIKILESRKFSLYFLEKYNLAQVLMASTSYDFSNEEFVFDSALFDGSAGEWVEGKRPLNVDMHEKYLDVFKVQEDKATGLVEVSAEFYSPKDLQKWLNALVFEVNEYMRRQDLEQAERSIRFLTEQLDETSLFKMQSVFFQLIEEQNKIIMLANARPEYIFRIIDPAFVSEKPSWPNKVVVIFVALVLGMVFSALIVFFRMYLNISGVEGYEANS
ncbi:hypothetical protein KO528_10560 [Saccharophagus degradans]|uniref:GNVR domain-containing protein n=1 Tax=Saccharophagus degradans TaxID=86304 RepID=UPI001C08E78E|nr:GNVR domain-containing protein [Saccharophagus degradans]MBU2985792.1 hypothetical protein [Saccharophagus degradans]